MRNSFSSIRRTEDFSDVTLWCEGERKIKAHKVILATGSGYFKALLKDNPYVPEFSMPDVKYKELSMIIDFIYEGRVEVSPNRNEIVKFLKEAENFQLVGICHERKDEGANVKVRAVGVTRARVRAARHLDFSHNSPTDDAISEHPVGSTDGNEEDDEVVVLQEIHKENQPPVASSSISGSVSQSSSVDKISVRPSSTRTPVHIPCPPLSKAKTPTAAPPPSHLQTQLQFEADLPPELLQQGWRKHWSKRENRQYFFNCNTEEAVWEMAEIPGAQGFESDPGQGVTDGREGSYEDQSIDVDDTLDVEFSQQDIVDDSIIRSPQNCNNDDTVLTSNVENVVRNITPVNILPIITEVVGATSELEGNNNEMTSNAQLGVTLKAIDDDVCAIISDLMEGGSSSKPINRRGKVKRTAEKEDNDADKPIIGNKRIRRPKKIFSL